VPGVLLDILTEPDPHVQGKEVVVVDPSAELREALIEVSPAEVRNRQRERAHVLVPSGSPCLELLHDSVRLGNPAERAERQASGGLPERYVTVREGLVEVRKSRIGIGGARENAERPAGDEVRRILLDDLLDDRPGQLGLTTPDQVLTQLAARLERERVQRVNHPNKNGPEYVASSNHGNSPAWNYAYAPPVPNGRHPRDAGRNMYPLSVIQSMPGREDRFDTCNPATGSLYWQYLNDDAPSDFLGLVPKESRGKHNIHALVSDGYFGGYNGVHRDSYNVLYGDFHAKSVLDPGRKITKAGISSGSPDYYGGMDGANGLQFQVWDYFSRSN